jgi:excisionase family DNA binding protein
MDWTREPLWLSTTEAGRRLGVTPRTVYSFINDGSLPGYRIGRKIQVLAADVDEFIEQARIEPSSPSQR